jgi:hypothetical protein
LWQYLIRDEATHGNGATKANSDIAARLAELGLDSYTRFFADNRVDFDVLPNLGEADTLAQVHAQGSKLGLTPSTNPR